MGRLLLWLSQEVLFVLIEIEVFVTLTVHVV